LSGEAFQRRCGSHPYLPFDSARDTRIPAIEAVAESR
jgi:hypothetical protein